MMTNSISDVGSESSEVWESLANQSFAMEAPCKLESLAAAMNQRFVGLPTFHRSIRLKVVENRTLISDTTAELPFPNELRPNVMRELEPDIHALLKHVNRKGGVKSLQLLRLRVQLAPHLASQHLAQLTLGRGRAIRSLVEQICRHVRVPIAMLVASTLRAGVYESLAVGIRGVTAYKSVLIIEKASDASRFQISGGLEAHIQAKHLDHQARRLISLAGLPEDLFDEYLKRYLYPERPEIVKRLCSYVLDSLAMEGEYALTAGDRDSIPGIAVARS